jgi:hypothetical protein
MLGYLMHFILVPWVLFLFLPFIEHSDITSPFESHLQE